MGLVVAIIELYVWLLRVIFRVFVWCMYWLLVVPVRAALRSSGRRRTRYWTHEGCSIHHRDQGTAARCRIGR